MHVRRRSRLARAAFTSLSLGVVAAASADAQVKPPNAAQGVVGSSLAFANATFESDSLAGWTTPAGALPATARKCGSERVQMSPHPNAPTTLPIGGNYWKVPAEATWTFGVEGSCWLELPKLFAIKSPPFTPQGKRWLRLLARTPGRGGRGVIEIQTDAGASVARQEVPVGDGMQQMLFDLASAPAQPLRVVITTPGNASAPTSIDGVLLVSAPPAHAPPAPPPAPIWGFADSHAHPMAHVAHGGKWLVGSNEGDLARALPHCPGYHGAPDGAGPGSGGHTNKKFAIDATEFAPGRGFSEGHNDSGWPEFEGWPRHTSVLHQQMHLSSIKRAFDGGLRLMVAHVGAYDLFARVAATQLTLDDAAETRRQVLTLKDFVNRSGFMEIAYTPADARRIIRGGKLAVVIGSEVDSFAGCKGNKACTRADLLREVHELHQIGVRHIIPIAHANNALGGAAIYKTTFNLNTWYLNGNYFKPASNPLLGSSETIAFRITNDDFEDKSGDSARFAGLSPLGETRWRTGEAPIAARNTRWDPPKAAYASLLFHMNEDGLYDNGKVVIEEMLKTGMIVDVDHMGMRSLADATAIAQRRGQPVMMGHTGFRALGYLRAETSDPEKLAHEGNKSNADVRALAELGGLLGVITNQGDVKASPASHVPSDCEGSSRSWLQAYVHAVSTMGGRSVAIGTDFNGYAGQPGPRFGSFACVGRNTAIGGSKPDPLRARPYATSREATRADTEAQRFGVAYVGPIQNNQWQRFAGEYETMPYDTEENFFWEAIVNFRAGKTPAQVYGRQGANAANPLNHIERVKNMVQGLYAQQLEADFPGNHFVTERNAAFLARTGAPIPSTLTPSRTGALAQKLRRVWLRHESMTQGSPNAGAPLVRSQMGNRDFDVNLDGLAHYGMLPDFLQDVHNQLAGTESARPDAVRDLRALFRSAEDYIVTWEKIDAGKNR